MDVLLLPELPAAVDDSLLHASPFLATMEHASKIGWLNALTTNGEWCFWSCSIACKADFWAGAIFLASTPLYIVGW